MNPLIIQSIRNKLERRVGYLFNLRSVELFQAHLRHLLAFCESSPFVSTIIQHLISQFPERISVPEIRLGDTKKAEIYSEDETALIGYLTLQEYVQHHNPYSLLFKVAHSLDVDTKGQAEELELVRQQFLHPFYLYLDEQLTNESVILNLLNRYKHRTEWFSRDDLWGIINEETHNAESKLARNLYLYLYDQGIDFHIEPSSITGKIDLITAQGTDDPLLADAKIFDGDKRGKSYICKGFGQIYSYTQQYNEPFGYLVIFKTTDRDLHLSFPLQSHHLPAVSYNSKTIFFLVIDIYPHEKPVSKRGPLNAIEITEQDLIHQLEATMTN